MQFNTIGSPDFMCLVKIFSNKEGLPEVKMKSKSGPIEAVHSTKKEIDFQVNGNTQITINW